MLIRYVKTNINFKYGMFSSIPCNKDTFVYIITVSGTEHALYTGGMYERAGIGFFCRLDEFDYLQTDGDFLIDALVFELENEEEKIVFSGVHLNTVLCHVFYDEIFEYIKSLEKEFNTPSSYRDNILSNLGIGFIYKILSYLERGGNTLGTSENYRSFYIFRNKMYKNPQLNWNVLKLSEETCFSTFYSQRLYREFFGTSFKKDVINARLTYAKHLLKNTNMNVYEIAEMCGYKNTEHFVRQFAEANNITPSKFRKCSTGAEKDADQF